MSKRKLSLPSKIFFSLFIFLTKLIRKKDIFNRTYGTIGMLAAIAKIAPNASALLNLFKILFTRLTPLNNFIITTYYWEHKIVYILFFKFHKYIDGIKVSADSNVNYFMLSLVSYINIIT